MTALLDAAALAEGIVINGPVTVHIGERGAKALRLLASHARETSGSRRADLLTLLAIASGHAPPCPYAKGADPRVPRPPTPDEWAAHLMAHAKALGRAVDAELADVVPLAGATLTAYEVDILIEQCEFYAANCPTTSIEDAVLAKLRAMRST